MEEVGRKEDRVRCTTRGVLLPSLKEIRRSRGMTQRDLARLAGVSTSTIYHLENGFRGAYAVTARKLAPPLGASVEELVLGRRH